MLPASLFHQKEPALLQREQTASLQKNPQPLEVYPLFNVGAMLARMFDPVQPEVKKGEDLPGFHSAPRCVR